MNLRFKVDVIEAERATATYTDTRCDAIARLHGTAVAEWADRNSAGWVLDALANPTAVGAAVAYVPVGRKP